MSGHDLICIGGSAGSVEASLRLVESLPKDLPAVVLIAIHLAADSSSNLPKLFEARGRLAARFAQHGEQAKRGTIYVARADRHLLVSDGTLKLSRGPHENGFRPSIDTLFRSAATAAGTRVIGVVLSGTLDDGTAGLSAVRRAGGIAVVQDPADAAFPDMPRNAIRGAGADHVVKLEDLAPLLARLAREPAAPQTTAVPERPESSFSPFVCPDCGGVLDLEDDDLPSFKCQVGHRWSGKGLATKQSEALELALWAALRTLVEHARLSRTLEQRALARGHVASARRFSNRARESEHRLQLVRRALGLKNVGRRPGEGREAERAEDMIIEEEAPRAARTNGDGGSPEG